MQSLAANFGRFPTKSICYEKGTTNLHAEWLCHPIGKPCSCLEPIPFAQKNNSRRYSLGFTSDEGMVQSDCHVSSIREVQNVIPRAVIPTEKFPTIERNASSPPMVSIAQAFSSFVRASTCAESASMSLVSSAGIKRCPSCRTNV